MKKTMAAILAGFFSSGSVLADDDSVRTYLSLTASGKTLDQEMLTGFSGVYENFDDNTLEQRVKDAYAETFYFNDTLVTLSTRKELTAYLVKSGERTNYIRTRILDVARSGDDVYVRWQLEMSFDVMGSARTSNTVGMTHLRFNEHGKIVLHQDFWDSAGGFYQTLPVVGRLISWVRNGLHP